MPPAGDPTIYAGRAPSSRAMIAGSAVGLFRA
jgi:hypothetical protein